MKPPLLPKLHHLPMSLPIDGAVRIELEEGIPIFRASSLVLDRIEELLAKQQTTPLDQTEEQELNSYEEIDDYLSMVNRMVRNAAIAGVRNAEIAGQTISFGQSMDCSLWD